MTRPRAARRRRGRLGACAAVVLLCAACARPAAAQVSVRGFLQAGLLRFAAAESFAAVTGRAAGVGLMYGAGGQVGFARLFVQASVERYAADGRRVFVFERRVFDLGIPSRITVTPIRFSVGYRVGARLAAYGAGGLGAYRFTETAAFGAPPGDEVREAHLGYHVLGGVERALWPWLRIGGEGQWSWVPGGLGRSGASAAFGETDLGGLSLRAKLSLGY